MPGAVRRRGPTKGTGDARSLHTGSVRTLSPPTWRRKVECPTQVAVSVPRGARGAWKLGVARAKLAGRGSGRRGVVKRSTTTQRSRAPRPCSSTPGQGFTNPPGRRWVWVVVSGGVMRERGMRDAADSERVRRVRKLLRSARAGTGGGPAGPGGYFARYRPAPSDVPLTARYAFRRPLPNFVS